LTGNLFWSLVILILGACIGSFLNVVIYRLPRGLSVLRPLRSFCPACERSIAWYDNVPVISYLLLGGRCRRCRSAISLQYPLVELTTALVFLMLFDALFVARVREGIGHLWTDWPMLAAHLVLLGGLIALSVMDLEAYMVDVRVTWIIAAAGVVAHAVWTPASSLKQSLGSAAMSLPGYGGWIRPGPLEAMVTLAATAGLVLGVLLFMRGLASGPEEVPESDEPAAEDAPQTTEQAVQFALPVRQRGGWHLPVLAVLAVLLVGYAVVVGGIGRPVSLAWLDVVGTERVETSQTGARLLTHPAAIRLGGGFVLCFIALALVASHPQPVADSEILEAIEAEAVDARHNALWELKLLSPAILLAAGAGAVLWWGGPGVQREIAAVLQRDIGGGWRPLLGLATGLSGWIIGGAVGWLARIVFTLAFGKEALGMGDVHILGAAGAVAGWPVALIGFFLAAPLALLAIVVIALRRQSRALPYGPWLALAFLGVCLFQDVFLRYARVRWLLE